MTFLSFFTWLQSVGSVLVFGMFLSGLGVYLLWRASKNKNSRIDISDILVDSSLKPPRVTLAKFSGVVALFASTWWITVLLAREDFSAEYLWAYLATWGAVKVAGDIWSSKESSGTRDDSGAITKTKKG